MAQHSLAEPRDALSSLPKIATVVPRFASFTSLPADVCSNIAWAWHDIAYAEGRRSDIRKLAAVNRFWRDVCRPVVWEASLLNNPPVSPVNQEASYCSPHAHLVRRLVLTLEEEYEIPDEKGRFPARAIAICARIDNLDLAVTPSRGNSTRSWSTRLHSALVLLSTRVHVIRLFCPLSESNSSSGYRTVGSFINARHVSMCLYRQSGRERHSSLRLGSRKLHSLTTLCDGSSTVHTSSDASKPDSQRNELLQLTQYSTRISVLWPHWLPLIGSQAVVYSIREQLEYLAVDISTTDDPVRHNRDPYTAFPNSCIPQSDHRWEFPRLKVFRQRSSHEDAHNFSFLPYIHGAPLEHLRLDHLCDATVQPLLDYVATRSQPGLQVGYRLHQVLPLSDHVKQELVDLCDERRVTLIDCSDLPPWREEVDLQWSPAGETDYEPLIM